MSRDKEILSALKALAEADASAEAPPEVEARLLEAFRTAAPRVRADQGIRPPKLAWAIAAAVVAMIAGWYFRPRPVTPVAKVATQPAKVYADFVDVAPVAPRPVVRPMPRRVPREIVTDFFPLMEAPPPLDRGAMLRVTLPAAAMRSVGLPVREDRLGEHVQADVLMSEEGMATAIRFVKFQ